MKYQTWSKMAIFLLSWIYNPVEENKLWLYTITVIANKTKILSSGIWESGKNDISIEIHYFWLYV